MAMQEPTSEIIATIIETMIFNPLIYDEQIISHIWKFNYSRRRKSELYSNSNNSDYLHNNIDVMQ